MSYQTTIGGSYKQLSEIKVSSSVPNDIFSEEQTLSNQSDVKLDTNQKNDNRLNDYFTNLQLNANFEEIQIDNKTKTNLCFQMNEQETVLYDYENLTLFKINTIHQTTKKENKLNTFETIIQEIKYEEICVKAFKDRTPEEIKKELNPLQTLKTQKSTIKKQKTLNSNQSQLFNSSQKTTINEGGQPEEYDDNDDDDENQEEYFDQEEVKPAEKLGEILTVACSSDKQIILLGNSEGRTFILDAQTFEYKDSFKNENGESIKFLSGNKEILVSASDKTLMLYDQSLNPAALLITDTFDITIQRVIVSPYSNHIVIQQQTEIFVHEYSNKKFQKFQSKAIDYGNNQFLKFTNECFFFWDAINLQSFSIQQKNWVIIKNLFENQGKDQAKIQFMETTTDKKHLFILGQNKSDEFKTCLIDSQGNKKTLIETKEQNFFVIFKKSNSDQVSLLNQNGLVLFKQVFKENIEINQLVYEDQELIYLNEKEQFNINCTVKFIQICDRSLEAQACRYKLIFNEKNNQIVINGQVKENQGNQTKTKILNFLDYTTKNFKLKYQNNQLKEKQYEKDADYAIYAISKNENYYYAQNKTNNIIQIDTELFGEKTILIDGTRHHFLAVDQKNEFLYYKQGKSIYQVKIEDSEKKQLFEICEQHIKDWKLSFDGKFLVFISDTTLYKYDIENKEKTQYSLKYTEIQQPYSFEDHACFKESEQNILKRIKNKIEIKLLTDQKKEQKYLTDLDRIDISPDDKYLALTAKNNNDIWIISLSDMKFQHRIEVFHKKNKQTERNIRCYFKNQVDKLTYQAIIIIANDKLDKVQHKIIGWDVTNMKNWQRLFLIRDQLIKPIIGFNNQLQGLLIDKKIRIWSQIFDEYSQNIPREIPTSKDDNQYISGPRNMIFPLIFKQFCENDHHDETQLQLMPYMMQNLVIPQRFSFFSYLGFRSKGKLIKKALEKDDLKLVRDYLGFHPLHYLIIKSNFEQTSELIEYIGKKPSLIKQLLQKEITDLLRFGPLFLENFLKICVKVLDSKECQKIDDDKQKYLQVNGVQVKNFNRFKNELISQNPDDQMPAEFKMILVPLNLKRASKSSLELMKAIHENEVLEIYRTDFLKNIIETKWQGIQKIGFYFYLIQVLQIFLVWINTFHPSWYLSYYALIFSGLKYLLVELVVFYKLGLTQKTNNNDSITEYMGKKLIFTSKSSLFLGLLLLAYSSFNLYAFNQYYTAKLLSIITMLSWFCLIRDLEMFQLIREFNLKFLYALEQSKGFIVFLFLMILTLTMTRTVLDKVKFREDVIQELNLPYNPSIDILEDDSIYTSRGQDLNKTVESMFNVIWSMVRGDFDADQYGIFDKFVGTLIIFITNVFLMNLLTAIVGDAFNEITTYSKEHLLKQANFITLRLEAIISAFSKDQSSEEDQNLFWIDYIAQDSDQWKSQAQSITESIKKILEDKLKPIKQNLFNLTTNLNQFTEKKQNIEILESSDNHQDNQKTINQKVEDSKQSIEKKEREFKESIENIVNNSQKSIEEKVEDSKKSIQTETNRVFKEFQEGSQNLIQQKVDESQRLIEQKVEELQAETIKQVNALNGNQTNILKQVSNSQESIQKLQAEMNNEMTKSKNEIVILQNNQNQIQLKVGESKNEIQQKVANLETQVTNLKTQVESLKTQVASLQNQAVGFQAEVKKEISDMKNEITSTLAQILQKLQEKE